MELKLNSADPLAEASDALIVLAVRSDDGPQLSPVAEASDAALDGELTRLASEARFAGKPGETFELATLGRLPARRIILAGTGPVAEIHGDALARAVGAGVRAARKLGARSVTVALPDAGWGMEPVAALESAAVGAGLGLYRFDRYRGAGEQDQEEERSSSGMAVAFHGQGQEEAGAERALRRAEAITRAVNLARDLGNEPAATLTPEAFAERARDIASSSGLEIEILGPDALAGLGANAMLTVGGGSANPPRLIRLRYQPNRGNGESRVVGLVGKAITFDTGGYSIKTHDGMLDMKSDMSGGAAVLGAMSALHALDCPVPVVATICAAENMISGTAFRPGDVITGMNGVTMEIVSTDAEGRLVLADGLVDTARRGATELIDLATLTGAAIVALGDGTTALFATDDALAGEILAAADAAGERTWRMPLIEEFESKIKGDVADLKNTGGRAGGAITAALFLRHFREGLPWAHLDIAGSARQGKASALGPKGATGVGVRTLLNYLTGDDQI